MQAPRRFQPPEPRDHGYRDRAEAGACLAGALAEYADRTDVLVLGLPRGGVPVAYEIATALHAPLDVLVVRKLGAPGQQELAIGAIASGGMRVLNHELVEALGLNEEEIEAIAAPERRELGRRETLLRAGRPFPGIAGRTVILVDDGVATGATMRAAIRALRQAGPAGVVVAVPVGAPAVLAELAEEADDVVCPFSPEAFLAISTCYREFPQLSDEEVRQLLERATQSHVQAGAGSDRS